MFSAIRFFAYTQLTTAVVYGIFAMFFNSADMAISALMVAMCAYVAYQCNTMKDTKWGIYVFAGFLFLCTLILAVTAAILTAGATKDLMVYAAIAMAFMTLTALGCKHLHT